MQTHEWASCTHAVVVCGHAIYKGGTDLQPSVAAEQDKYWVLQAFQQGEGPYYIEHIHAGVEITATDPSALLIFSGGQTRYPHIISEAQGYHNLATLFNFWGHDYIASRTTTEEFARDSYDNVLFSLARFLECTGIGTPDDLQSALTAEARTLHDFKADNTGYGKDGGPLGKKKMARNPYRRQHGYASSCPSLAPLLDWTETTAFAKDQAPWSEASNSGDDK